MNVLKLLVNPIFLLAAGLHAGLLMIPVSGGSSGEIVPAPDPEGESITVTRIPPKQSQPVAGQATRTSPTQVAATQASGKPASSSANQQQKSKGDARQQSNQSSGTQAGQNTNANEQTANDSRPSTSADDAPPGLPDLPADEASDRVSVTVETQEQTAQPGPTLTALRNGVESKVPKPLKTFLERLRYSLLKTRDVETEEAKQAWLAQLAEQSNIATVTPQELEKALEISYPVTVDDNGPREISSCLNPLPESGLLGIAVDENGAIAADPKLLRSTGYAFLNDVALKRIDAYTDLPETNLPQAYTVPVAINYDKNACVNLADLSPDVPETTAASDR